MLTSKVNSHIAGRQLGVGVEDIVTWLEAIIKQGHDWTRLVKFGAASSRIGLPFAELV